eukprot:1060360-Pleurochrysis_carterae.AAC.2
MPGDERRVICAGKRSNSSPAALLLKIETSCVSQSALPARGVGGSVRCAAGRACCRNSQRLTNVAARTKDAASA